MFSPHGHVRIQRVVLEHHRDVPIPRREIVDDVVADPDDALGDVLEPGDHSQRRRLAGAGRADQDHELSIRNREVHVLDRLYAVGVALGHVFESYAGHPGPFLRATRRARRLRRTAARRRLRRT